MYYTLCRAYRGHDGPSKEKEASKPYKEVMREHEGVEFVLYHFHHKGEKSSSHRVILMYLRDTSQHFISS